jgi:hypothetical protein
LADDLVSADINGYHINEKGALLANNTTLQTVVESGCAEQVAIDISKPFPLAHDVLKIEVDKQVICIESGITKKFHNLRLQAGELFVLPTNSVGRVKLVPTEQNAVLTDVAFRQLIVWTEPDLLSTLLSAVVLFASGIGLGILSNQLFERFFSRRSSQVSGE